MNVVGAGPTITNTLLEQSYYGGIALLGTPQPTIAGNTVTGSPSCDLLTF